MADSTYTWIILKIKRFCNYATLINEYTVRITCEIDLLHFINASPMQYTGNFLLFADMSNNLNCFELITFYSHSYCVTFCFVLFCLLFVCVFHSQFAYYAVCKQLQLQLSCEFNQFLFC